MNLDACWSHICEVDVGPLREWVESIDPACWPEQASPTKPQRIHENSYPSTGGVVKSVAVDPIITKVLAHFDVPAETDRVMLSRMRPGQSHPMHVDNQRSNWITRVHVPVVTNDGCWMAFEEEDKPVHFLTGHAYTFNALRRHAFGNSGDGPRIHLIWDVLRAD